jgi:DNA-3-methyladenine glycosylase II
MTTTASTIPILGRFSLAESGGFLGSMRHLAASTDEPAPLDHLHVAFVPDRRPSGAVGACVTQPGPDHVAVELSGDVGDAAPVLAQVARMLSIDVDGRAYDALGESDPVVAHHQAARPGFRPVNFASPFEAAAHFLMSQRISMRQAAAIKQRLAAELGERVTICGHEVAAFPGPERVATLTDVSGLTERKVGYLQRLADAAMTTDLLDGAAIRAQAPADAIAALEALPGVGPFTSAGIVIRGAGAPDVLTLHEPRVRRAVATAYEREEPLSDEQLIALAESWRPFRSWVMVLLRAAAGSE